MVGDLVVVDEVDVDGLRPAHHRLDDQRDVEVTQEHVGGRAQGDVRPSPVDARLDSPAHLASGLEDLLAHLADGEDDRPQDAGGVREERGVRL